MRVRRKEGGRERRGLTALITSKEVLARVAPIWPKENGLFGSDWSNRIARWCVSHYRRYGRAPGNNIEAIFEEWAEKATNKDEVTAIERYIGSLSEEYARSKSIDPDHVIDTLEELFNKNHLTQEQAKVEELIEAGKVSEALKLRDAYKRISLKGEDHIDLFDCANEVKLALDSVKQPPLVKYPGGLGKFFGRQLARDSLVGIMAAEKMGKSYWLLDIAYRGLQQGRKVAYFQVGDLSRDQIMQRLCERTTNRPWDKGKYYVPESIEIVDEKRGIATTELKLMTCKLPMTDKEAIAALKKEVKQKDAFRLFVYPNASVNILAIESRLESMAQKGWCPDVVCIAEGSLVLTSRGLVPIEKVRRSDRLWDGVNWVTHDGPVFKGVKDVIEYAGLTATPDHEVWTEQGWRTLESCRRLGLRVAKTGDGRQEVWVGKSYITEGSRSVASVQEVRQDLPVCTQVRFCKVCALRQQKVVHAPEPYARDQQGVPHLPPTQAIPHMVLGEAGECKTAVRKPQSPVVASLRWSGYQVQVPFGYGGLSVADCKRRPSRQVAGDRQDRERWSLRTGKPAVLDKATELVAYLPQTSHHLDAPFQATVSRCEVCGRHATELFREGDNTETNRIAVGNVPPQIWRGKAPVWDILNAGPLHRFTVQGVLAHNCLDYADILLPIDGTVETRDQINQTWTIMRSISQKRNCLFVTATQASAAAYKATKLDKSHFSNDKRKYAHITAMFAINQEDEEKEFQVQRLNWLDVRSEPFSRKAFCYVAGCLATSNPSVKSIYGDDEK